MLEALARSGIAGGSCRALGDAGGPGRAGADGDGNLPPAPGSRGFQQRRAGGGDSAARVLLGTVTASGTAWPWPVSHAPPRWLVLGPGSSRILCVPSGHQCCCPLLSLMLLFPVSLWSPILLFRVSLWSLMLLSLLSSLLLSPFIPLVTSPMLLSPLSLWSLMLLCPFIPVVTDASVPCTPLVMRLDLCHGAQPAARGHRALWGPATRHP